MFCFVMEFMKTYIDMDKSALSKVNLEGLGSRR